MIYICNLLFKIFVESEDYLLIQLIIFFQYLPGQYIGDFYDYQTGTTSTVINNLSCPDYTNGITQCQYSISYGCPSYEQVITCIRREFIHYTLRIVHVVSES